MNKLSEVRNYFNKLVDALKTLLMQGLYTNGKDEIVRVAISDVMVNVLARTRITQ